MSTAKQASLTNEQKEKLTEILKDNLPSSYQDLASFDVFKRKYSFYPEWTCYEIGHREKILDKTLIVFVKKKEAFFLDWTPQKIYDFNIHAPLQMDLKNICDYLEFFFERSRGSQGRVLLINNSDHFHWREEPPLAIRKTLASIIQPAMVVAWDEEKKLCEIKAFLLFKNHLFSTLIQVDGDGIVDIKDRRLQVEDMPILDDFIQQ